jgi:hypothetical protein
LNDVLSTPDGEYDELDDVLDVELELEFPTSI